MFGCVEGVRSIPEAVRLLDLEHNCIHRLTNFTLALFKRIILRFSNQCVFTNFLLTG